MTFDVEFVVSTLVLNVFGGIIYSILHSIFDKIVKIVRKNNRHE